MKHESWQFLFFWGGGGGEGGGVRGSRNLGGSSTSFKLWTTKVSIIIMHFSYSVTLPPQVSGSAPEKGVSIDYIRADSANGFFEGVKISLS